MLYSRFHSSHFPLRTPNFTLLTLRLTFYTLPFTPHTPRRTLYTGHFSLLTFTLYTFHPELQTSHSTLHTLSFSLQILQFTLHTLHSIVYANMYNVYKSVQIICVTGTFYVTAVGSMCCILPKFRRLVNRSLLFTHLVFIFLFASACEPSILLVYYSHGIS